MKIHVYKETVPYWLVNLFTVIFLCLIVRPGDCTENCESQGKTLSLERSGVASEDPAT